MKRKLIMCLVLATLYGCGAAPDGVPQEVQPTASERTSDPAAVIDKRWQWLGTTTPIETITAAEPDRYTIRLGADGRAEVRFDCNTGGGEYRIDTGSLQFGPLMSTRMACPPDSQDAEFSRQLEAVRIFFVEDGILYLDLFADSGTMRFGPAAGE